MPAPGVPPSAVSAAAAHPLVVTADEELLDELLALLGAAGAEPEVTTGGPLLRRTHREAPLVLVGADALATAAVRGLPRRPGLLVVAREDLAPEGWSAAVELGAERVVLLPRDEGWLLSRVAGAACDPVERGWVAAVGGSCGGAGASTLATALALAAAAEHGRALLIDGDAAGGGLDLLLGAERADGLRWPELAGLRGRVDGAAVLAALPETAGVHVLAASHQAVAPVAEEALGCVVGAVRAAGCPVVVDLPRGGSAVEAVLAEADLAVLLVPARLRAACAARSLLQPPAGGGRSPWDAARLVLRRLPGGLSRADVSDVVGRPVGAELRHDPRAVARGERGEPPPIRGRSTWRAVSSSLLADLRRAPEPGS